jgi:hypothetical protein
MEQRSTFNSKFTGKTLALGMPENLPRGSKNRDTIPAFWDIDGPP